MPALSEESSLVVALAVVAGLLVYKLHKDRQRPTLKLPPSPRSYPLIGNLLSIPQEHEYLGFMKLGKELGSDIISLSAFGTTIVALNKREDVINLFEKRSAIYSDRTIPAMVAEPSLLNWAGFASVVRYGDRWRMYRRLLNPWIHKQAATAFHGSQEQEARKFLQRLLKVYKNINTSEELEAELCLTIASTLTRSVYGHEAKSIEDPYIVAARSVFGFLSKAALASNYSVNSIPALLHVPDWLPGAGWKQEAREWRQKKEEIVGGIYQLAMDHVKKGTEQNVIAASLKKHGLQLGLTEDQADDYVQQIAITLFAGGMDTTVNTLLMFTVAMILFPEVQKKAQEELDKVIGNSRLPAVTDREQLDYTWRLVQEVLRWGPVAPIAFPHTCFEDDNYKGYDIPKGTILIGNVWALSRDPEVYKDPETFDPDRFLDPSVPPSSVFGWGRRRCPGVHFAEASLFSVIATLLIGFKIEPAQDEHGNDIRPTLEMHNAAVICPKPFKFKFIPRSAGRHEELLRSVLEA